jgi:hypothetical protein
VMRDFDEVVKKVIRLMTRCTMAPVVNTKTGDEEYSQITPRHRVLLISVNDVVETRMSDSRVPAEQLKREKPKITYISSSDLDVKKVIKAVCQDYQEPDMFERVECFGTGQAGLEKYRDAFVNPRHSLRARKIQNRASLQETQENIALTDAPLIDSEY